MHRLGARQILKGFGEASIGRGKFPVESSKVMRVTWLDYAENVAELRGEWNQAF